MIRSIVNNTFLTISLLVLLSSCFRDPEFSDTPRIAFGGLQFFPIEDGADSLLLTINFEDGDGNLGLGRNETDPKFNAFCFFDSITGAKSLTRIPTAIKFGEFNEANEVVRTTTIDTLPDYIIPDIACLRYTTIEKEIFYAIKNKFNNNIFVDFMIKQDDGTFNKFIWETSSDACGTSFDGRFPLLKEEIDRASPLEGSLTYKMLFRDYRIFTPFVGKTLKLRVSISDRNLNVSNSVETMEFDFETL